MIKIRDGITGISATRLFVCCFLLFSFVFISLLGVSCSAIPGADECNAVVDSFMKAAAQKDVDTAYNLCVEEMAYEDIESLVIDGNQFFAGYQDIKMKSINIEYEGNRDYAEYSGEAYYSGDKVMRVESELIKRGEEWQIVYISVSP